MLISILKKLIKQYPQKADNVLETKAKLLEEHQKIEKAVRELRNGLR